MNYAGYLLTLANLAAFRGPDQNLEDMTMRVAPLENLVQELRSLPDFPIEGFRQNGYYRSGYLGKYLSRSLQDYLFHGKGQPTDQGLIVTLIFKDASDDEHDDTQVLHDDNSHSAFYVRGKEMDPAVNDAVKSYIDSRKYLQTYY